MKNIKMIIILMVAVFLIGIGSGMGLNRVLTNNNINKINKQPITIVRTLTQSTDDVKLDKGDTYREFSDGSFSIENDEKGFYEFQTYIMGDWDYIASNKEELNKMIQTYIDNTNE